MKNISKDKQVGSVHLGLVAAIAVVLMGVIGFLFWNNFVTKTNDSTQLKSIKNPENAASESKSEAIKQDTHQLASGWTTYTDVDIPFTFDYHKAWVFEKNIKDVDGREGFSQGKYRLITINGRTDVNNGKLVIYFRDGVGSNFMHINECFRSQGRELISVSNDYSNDEPVLVCGEKKLWELSYDEGKRTIVVITTDPIDIATFKNLIQSIRKK